MQKLEIYQSLWAMELRSPHVPERTPEESFAIIAAAGFDGHPDPGLDDLGRVQADATAQGRRLRSA